MQIRQAEGGCIVVGVDRAYVAGPEQGIPAPVSFEALPVADRWPGSSPSDGVWLKFPAASFNVAGLTGDQVTVKPFAGGPSRAIFLTLSHPPGCNGILTN